MLEIERSYACCWGAVLLGVLSACSTEVDIYRLRLGRGVAGSAGAASATSSNSTNILVPRGAAAPHQEGCQPGHYVGTFAGTYKPAVTISFPLAIDATSAMGRPGLEFWMERTANECGDEEFCAEFTLKGGKIRGFANPISAVDTSSDGAAVAVPFEMDLAGDLDCSRGQFRGLLLNGCYDLATIVFRFAGNAIADYDPASSTFINGAWAVKEMPLPDAWYPSDPDIGGMGSWQAALANDTAMPAADGGSLCSM